MIRVFTVLFGLTLMAAIGLFITSVLLNDNRFMLVAVAHLCLAALLFLPVMSAREIWAFEPMTLFVMFLILGTVGNSYVLAFGDGKRRDTLMNGEPIELFIWGGLWLALAMVLVGLGYTVCKGRLRIERILPDETKFTTGGLHLVALMGLGVALLATVAYIQQTGGISSLANLSKKRVIEVATEGEVVYANGGYLRLVAALPMMLLYLMIAHYLRAAEKLKPWQSVFVFLLLLSGMILPFVSSSRASIVYALIGVLLVYSVFRTISAKFVTISLVAALSLFAVMSGLRVYANTTGGGVREGELAFQNPLLSLAESGNGMSLSGTTLIIDGVPERMDYKLGMSYLALFTAPIPRSMWPAKPQISLGKEIKEDILGKPAPRAGRPASLIAEGFINFGWIGFFGMAFVFGFLMRLLVHSFRPIMQNSVFAAAIYIPFFVNIPAFANGSFGQGSVRILSSVIPLYLIYIAAIALSIKPKPKVRRSVARRTPAQIV